MNTDDDKFSRLIVRAQIFQFVVIVLAAVAIVLALVIVGLVNRGTKVVAVLPSGQAALTGSATEELQKNMALFETREFLECLHTQDAVLGPAARRKALWHLSPNVRQQIAKDVADSVLLLQMAQSRIQSRIEWDIPPKIVDWKYPGTRLFAAFQVVNRDPLGNETRVKHNMTLDGSFFTSTENRPSGFLVTRFTYVTDGRDLNTILNKIGG